MASTTKYLWDDEADAVVMEKDGSDTTQAVYHSDPVQYGRLFSMRRGGKTYNYRYDAQGNTRALTDVTGKTTDTYSYDAWGDQRSHVGNTDSHYRFGGQYGYQFDSRTNDYYVRARIYQPKRARWSATDPLRFAEGSNSYAYAKNTPVTSTDPSGLFENVISNLSMGGFTNAWIEEGSKYDLKTKKLRHLGSELSITFRPRFLHTPFNPFLVFPPGLAAGLGCASAGASTAYCKCNKTGFIQITNSKAKYSFTTLGLKKIRPGWHVDSGLPYPFSTTGSPCHRTSRMTDDPGIKFALRLVSFYQAGEACVACLDNVPRIKLNAGGHMGISGRLTPGDLRTYCCTYWKHSFIWNRRRKGYNVLRMMDGHSAQYFLPLKKGRRQPVSVTDVVFPSKKHGRIRCLARSNTFRTQLTGGIIIWRL